MPKVRSAGPFPLAGVAMESWIVRFDKNGVCSSPRTKAALLERLAARNDAPILFFSHGWNNDFEDAVSLYGRFLQNLEAVLAKHPVPGPRPIFVGVTWPGIWLPSDEGPAMASAEADLAEAPVRDRILRELLDILPAGTDWPRLYALLEADELAGDEARALASLLRPALNASDEGASEAAASEDAILHALDELQDKLGSEPVPDDLDEIGTVGGIADNIAPDAAGFLSKLDPRWALRLASLYIMKDRAGTVGWTGIGALLREMLERSAAPVHAIGHSYGGKVMLSALVAPMPLSRPVRSLLLLQPAVSHLSFAARVPGRDGPGGYRLVLDRVSGRILSTYSAHDFPLRTIYHLALLRRGDLGELQVAADGEPPSVYAALGGYGPRGAGEHLVDPIPAPGERIPAPAEARLIGLDGSQFNRIDGHGGVANPFTAWALLTQMAG